MHPSRPLDVVREDSTSPDIPGEDTTHRPPPALHWWRIGKLILALALLGAAGYFFHEQIWTSTSIEGTITSPLITIRSPIDGVLVVNTTRVGAPVTEHETLFVIEAHQLDTRLRAELEAKLAAVQQQALVSDRKISELSTLHTHLQTRTQAHRDATLARLDALVGETTAALNRAKEAMERTQREVSRTQTLATRGLIAPATLDDAVLADKQAHADVEQLSASLKRLGVERAAAKKGVLLGEGYSDAPYSQQRIDELAARKIEAKADRASLSHTQQELASRLAEEQQRESTIRTYTVYAPISGLVWNRHVATNGVVSRHAPLVDLVDCRHAIAEAMLPERRYDDVRIGETVAVKLLGNRRKIPGTIHAVRGQSATINRESLAASLTPHRTTEALTISVALDPEALQHVSKGVCQIGRSAKVFFNHHGDGDNADERLAVFTRFVASAFAAIVPPTP